MTVEENAIMGGAGSAVSECLSAHHQHPKILHLGLPDTYIDHGNPDEMLADCGLNADGILKSVQDYAAIVAHHPNNRVLEKST